MTLPPKGPPSSIELSSSTTSFKHEPVMLQEILETFKPIENGLFIDATVGGAGHAQALLTQAPKRELIGIDRDISAVEIAASRLKGFGDRAQVQHARFDEIGKIIDDDGRPLRGAIFDLGVSSHQLDTP